MDVSNQSKIEFEIIDPLYAWNMIMITNITNMVFSNELFYDISLIKP